jgi:glycosyltransferase involved in cell wall biosynthesis
MEVVRNGVDTARWPAAVGGERLAARAELGLDPHGPLAVVVGRLCEQKGQDLLIRAWPAISSQVPRASVAMVGAGPAREELQLAIGRRTDITLVGESGRVGTWLAAADVAVFPSRWDGLSLALLEAASTGRSVVATDVGGVREVLGEGPGAGGAVIAGSEDEIVAGLASAIAARLGDPARAETEGRAARRRIEDGFTLDRALQATADITLRLADLRTGALGSTGPPASR